MFGLDIFGNTDETLSGLEEMHNELSRDIEEDASEPVDLRGLMGAPPCFSQLADLRYEDSNNCYGYDYLDSFIEEGNFVTFQVGRPQLQGNKDAKEEALDSITPVEEGGEEDGMLTAVARAMQGNDGELFTFKDTMNEYWEDVRLIIGILANMMGIPDSVAKSLKVGSDFDQANWDNYQSKFIQEWGEEQANIHDNGRAWNYVPFYNDGVIEAGESLSHETGPSSIEQTINNAVSGAGKAAGEFAYISGQAFGEGIDNYSDSDEDVEEKTGFLERNLDKVPVLSDIMGTTSKILNVKMNLPDVWKDSSYSKEYNLKFKFTSPHGDPTSIFLNVLIPLAHLLPMVAPRQVGATNTYLSPYILRIYCLGMANCDMGMATNIQIERNQRAVSADGLPTEINVTVTVKDLMPALGLPEERGWANMFTSKGLFGYLGTLAGFNAYYHDSVMGQIIQDASLDYKDMTEHLRPTNMKRTMGNKLNSMKANFGNNMLGKWL